MKLNDFLDKALEVAVYGGVATKDPTEENLLIFKNEIDSLKRESRCYVPDDKDFKKQMPHTWEILNGVMEHAESGRLALREVTKCGLVSILADMLDQR